MRLGRRQLDLLDSLRDEQPRTMSHLCDQTGACQARTHESLMRLLIAGLVDRAERKAGARHWFDWWVTPRGLEELALRERAGRVPGVPYTGRTPVSPRSPMRRRYLRLRQALADLEGRRVDPGPVEDAVRALNPRRGRRDTEAR